MKEVCPSLSNNNLSCYERRRRLGGAGGGSTILWTSSSCLIPSFTSPTFIGDAAVGVADVIVRRLQTLCAQNEHTKHGSHTHTHTAEVCQIPPRDGVRSMYGRPFVQKISLK